MVITTLSTKHQTTIPMEFVKSLGLSAGTRLKQSLEGNRIILEPIPDLMASFGILSKPAEIQNMSIREETEAMEMAVALEVMGKAGLE